MHTQTCNRNGYRGKATIQKGRMDIELDLNTSPHSMMIPTLIALTMLVLSHPTIDLLIWLVFVVKMPAS